MRSAIMRRAVRAGLLAGMAIVYLALVGMVQKFDSINIVEDKLSLGRLLMLLPPLLAGFFTARPRIRAGEVDRPPRREAILAGVLIGALAGGMIALGIAIVHVFPDGAVRNIFSSVTPLLMMVLSFQRSAGVGTGIFFVPSVAGAVVGAALNYLPAKAGKPVQIALLITVLSGMLQNVLRVALSQLGLATDWL